MYIMLQPTGDLVVAFARSRLTDRLQHVVVLCAGTRRAVSGRSFFSHSRQVPWRMPVLMRVARRDARSSARRPLVVRHGRRSVVVPGQDGGGGLEIEVLGRQWRASSTAVELPQQVVRCRVPGRGGPVLEDLLVLLDGLVEGPKLAEEGHVQLAKTNHFLAQECQLSIQPRCRRTPSPHVLIFLLYATTTTATLQCVRSAPVLAT